MTAGLRFVVCLQEAGWNQVRRIQQTVFLPPPPVFFFFFFFLKRIVQSTQQALSTRVKLFTCIFPLFSTRVVMHMLDCFYMPAGLKLIM